MGCITSSTNLDVLDTSKSDIDRSDLTYTATSSAVVKNDFVRSIENISEMQLTNDIKSNIVDLFQKYNVTKRLFLRSSKHDMKDLLLKNIPKIDKNQFNAVYYALYHCGDDPIKHKKCGHLTVHKGTTLHLKSDMVFEYESICLEENSILTAHPWNNTTRSGGQLYINSKTNIILHKNAKIDVSGLGYKVNEYDDIGKPPDDKLHLTMGRGLATKHQARGGGIIKIHCSKLIMYNNSEIVANVQNKFIKAKQKGSGGSIFIDTDNIIMMNAFIKAEDGKVIISISSSCFIKQFVSINANIFIPEVIVMLIMKYWAFRSNQEKRQIKPLAYLIVK